MPIVTRKVVGTYLFSSNDVDSWLRLDSPSPISALMRPNSDSRLHVEAQIVVEQKGAGQVSFVAAEGVQIVPPGLLKTRRQWSVAFLTQVEPNEWNVSGDLTGETP
jgi:hypothetical protein